MVSCQLRWFAGLLVACAVQSCALSISGPQFTAVPAAFNRTFKYGEKISAYLRCGVANATDSYKISWFKTSYPISDNQTIRNTSEFGFPIDSNIYSIYTENKEGTFNLNISLSESTDIDQYTGEYSCTVRHAANDTILIKSEMVKVEIFVVPRDHYPVCSVEGKTNHNITLFAGDLVNISCQTDPGIPHVAITWFKDNSTPIVNSTFAGLTARPTLRHFLSPDSNSYFTCKVRQEGFEKESECRTGLFTVYEPPNVIILPEAHDINSEADTVEFTCNASVLPDIEMDYIWVISKHGGYAERKPGLMSPDATRSVKVGNLTHEYNGKYTVSCTVDYDFSSRKFTANATLTVNIKPTIKTLRAPTVTEKQPNSETENVTSVNSTIHWRQAFSGYFTDSQDHTPTSIPLARYALPADKPKLLKFHIVIIICVSVAAVGALFLIIAIAMVRAPSRNKRGHRKDAVKLTSVRYRESKYIVFNEYFQGSEATNFPADSPTVTRDGENKDTDHVTMTTFGQSAISQGDEDVHSGAIELATFAPPTPSLDDENSKTGTARDLPQSAFPDLENEAMETPESSRRDQSTTSQSQPSTDQKPKAETAEPITSASPASVQGGKNASTDTVEKPTDISITTPLERETADVEAAENNVNPPTSSVPSANVVATGAPRDRIPGERSQESRQEKNVAGDSSPDLQNTENVWELKEVGGGSIAGTKQGQSERPQTRERITSV